MERVYCSDIRDLFPLLAERFQEYLPQVKLDYVEVRKTLLLQDGVQDFKPLVVKSGIRLLTVSSISREYYAQGKQQNPLHILIPS